MSTINVEFAGKDPQQQADEEAVIRFMEEGTPIPPDVVERIHQRAEKVREEIFKRVGYIDVDALLRSPDDDL